MMGWRRHDGWLLRSFLGALCVTLLFLSMLVVVFDVAERLDKLPKVVKALERTGRSGTGLLVEFYLTLLPFLWMRILPIVVLIAASATLTWLGRQNELIPLVASGVPTRRVLRPIFLAALVLAALQSVARETIVPGLSRRHADINRFLADRGRPDRFQDVPHVQDTRGGRLSMAAFFPSERRMEGVWITFRRAPEADGFDVAYGYPMLLWDATAQEWKAERGGQRRVLGPRDAADAQTIPAGASAPLAVDPAFLELTLRQSAAMGLSSQEIATLARDNPDRTRLTLLLHQQWAHPASTLVLLLLGLPFVFRLGRRGVTLSSFVGTLGLVASYYLVDSVITDLGARGGLNPIVAAWAPHVIYGALGVALLSTLET